MITFQKIRRILEGSILVYMISQVFLDNIMLALEVVAFNYIYDPFMSMTYKMVKKEKEIVITSQLKYTNIFTTKDHPQKPYPKKEYNKINAVEVSTKEKLK